MSPADSGAQVPLTVLCSEVVLGEIQRAFLVPCADAVTWPQESGHG